MHDDCMSEKFINDEIAKAVFIDVDIVKAMELLKDRNIMSFSERYIDPQVVAREKRQLLEKYQLMDGFLDLKGRGFFYEDLCNAFLATQLMAYRYIFFSAANYGIVPEKTWKAINPNTWRLKISVGDKFEIFYFRRDGMNWYLTDREFVDSTGPYN